MDRLLNKFAGSILLFVVLISLIISCTQNKKQPAGKVPAVLHSINPQPVKLPFGSKIGLDTPYDSRPSEKFHAEALHRHIYKLPPIKYISYKSLSFVDSGKCMDSSLFEKHIKLSNYRYRLPKIGKLQCYYWCGDVSGNEYSEQEQQNCQGCLLDSYGYLIIYNPRDQRAHVLTIYFDTFRDGENYHRNFYVDKDYNIYLTDISQDSDAGDEDALPMETMRYKVKISADGSFSVREIK